MYANSLKHLSRRTAIIMQQHTQQRFILDNLRSTVSGAFSDIKGTLLEAIGKRMSKDDFNKLKKFVVDEYAQSQPEPITQVAISKSKVTETTTSSSSATEPVIAEPASVQEVTTAQKYDDIELLHTLFGNSFEV